MERTSLREDTQEKLGDDPVSELRQIEKFENAYMDSACDGIYLVNAWKEYMQLRANN